MEEKKLIVKAGNHDRKHCPLSVEIQVPSKDRKMNVHLTDTESGERAPAQFNFVEESTKVKVQWILDSLKKGKEKEYTIKFSREPYEALEDSDVTVKEADGRIDVDVRGRLFIAYNFGGDVIRPYIYPVLASGGRLVTRSFPMVRDVSGETKDHSHHRSIWTAHGDVNRVDNWSEVSDCGKILHRTFDTLVSGPVYGEIASRNDWVSHEGKRTLEEERRLIVYNTPESMRIMDLEVSLKATEGDVTFGDTKEGGIVSVRVASSMDVAKGGRIANAYGGINEGETWGRRAQWCDYSGPVEGSWIGIAIFDGSKNFRHPTYWHVRDYGLMTANPFGVSHFTGDPKKDGSFTLKKGESLQFYYRIIVHEGDAEKGRVADRYHDFANPPKIIIS